MSPRTLLFIFISVFSLQQITLPTASSNSSCNFRFGSMVLLTGSRLRQTVAAGFNMALQDYKNGYLYNNPYLNITHLQHNNQNCLISTNMQDMQSDIKIGIVKAFEFGQSLESKNMSDINVPIVIGPPTSSYSLTLNPLYTAFNLLQFSSTATSTFLSEYDTFFRSVPSDDLQANALIQLCKYFAWHNIGILYMNTQYGSSLQQSLTFYANLNGIESTTFSYIDGDNITISDAVQSMKQSRIYINILIAFGSDLEEITRQITKQNMVGYPFYFLGTDSWLGTIGEDTNNYLDIYGGIIGTCPWKPSLNDPFVDKYPYPINESIHLFTDFSERWTQYYNSGMRNDTLYGYEKPGFFTGYAYDNVLTVIKSINEYVKLYGFGINNDSERTDRFSDILRKISFVGLTGNVSFDSNGDRSNGLFSFCNINTTTGEAHTIGYVIDNKQELSVEIDVTLVQWPKGYQSIPKYEYVTYKGIPQTLLAIVWCFCVVSMLCAVVCMCCLGWHKQRQIIKSSQWRLSCIMCIGIITVYLSVLLYGIDENMFEYHSQYFWDTFCTYRVLLFNTAFSLTFGPLFFKIYRIKIIFGVGKKLKKAVMTDTKMAIYNLCFVLIDLVLCLVLIFVIPSQRMYVQSEVYVIEKEFYGNCSSEYWYVYGLVLMLPKLVFCVYTIIISISVYNTVSIMKYNEGLQVLITVIVSIIFVLIVTIILSILDINSTATATFYYAFLSLILLIMSNFVIVMMLLPRLAAIWRGMEDEYLSNDKHIQKKVKLYMSKLARFKSKRSLSNSKRASSSQHSLELSSLKITSPTDQGQN